MRGIYEGNDNTTGVRCLIYMYFPFKMFLSDVNRDMIHRKGKRNASGLEDETNVNFAYDM